MIIYPHAIIHVTDDVRVEHRAGFTPTAYIFHFGFYAGMCMGPWA